jgi:4'-phosphopantetheinyl transferase
MNPSEVMEWREVSLIPALGQNEIQVWRIPLARSAAEVSQLQTCLSAAELAQAARFHFAADQRRFVVRRAVLRQLLAATCHTSPDAVQLGLGTQGKPFIAQSGRTGDLRFSCSHSADWALVALARGIELGVDLEQQRNLPDAAELARRFFSNDEVCALEQLPPALKTAGFFNCWTRKEAFVKALGLGLSCPLNRFTVSLAPDRPAALLAVADDPAAVQQWSMVALDAGPDFSAALVFEGNQSAVKCFQFS